MKPMTKRQTELCQLLIEGMGNAAIGQRLGITEHTVKVHLWRLYREQGVNSRGQLVAKLQTQRQAEATAINTDFSDSVAELVDWLNKRGFDTTLVRRVQAGLAVQQGARA